MKPFEALPGGDAVYRWVMETANTGIWAIDAFGRITFANARMGQLLGTTAEELIGRSVLDFVEPEHHGEMRMRYEVLRAGKTLVAETTYRRVDGTHFNALLESTPIFENGELVGGIGGVIDVTQWKNAEAGQRESQARVEAVEAQLRQAQKMEAVGRLAGGIAHDFNNMLLVILGYGESLLERVQGDPDAREDVEAVLEAGRRAAELTRSLLMFSRRHVMQPKLVDLSELLQRMKKMIDRIVGEDIEIAYVPYTFTDPPIANIDPSGFEQVIMNLVVNARDAMPTGGKLTIGLADAGPRLALTVRDTGMGMDAATKARAFDPFFTTKEQGKGTGLGLSTVYGIVEQAGATIVVESTPGNGALFEVLIPRRDGKGPTTSLPPSSTGRKPAAATILLVEDEEQVRAVARRALERQGHKVIAVRSAIEALGTDRRDVELLVTDVIMPHMSGAELAQRLLEKRPT
jgi:PAS domain S-box-containing protein